MAQTANPVTLYGRAHATFESVEATAGTFATVNPEQVRRNRVSDQSSLFGIRGTEDLGGGLKAFFQLETVFRVDQNDSAFAQRNSGVGLQGGWGSLLLGRWDTPYKTVTTAIDPFGDVTLGGWIAAMNGAGMNGLTGGNALDRRDQNVVQYWSPSWGGVAIRLSYAANEGRTSTACPGRPASSGGCNPRSNGASVSYTGGPVYVAYAYHELKDQPTNSLQFTVNTALAVTAIAFPTVTPIKATGNELVGTLTFGPIKIGGAYEKIKRGNTGAAPAAGVVTGFSDRKAFAANFVGTFGNNQIIFQYQNAKDGGVRVQGTPTLAINVTEPECKVYAGAYQYNFSRRTFFLAQYTRIDNNVTGTCNFASNPLTTSMGADLKGISLGIRHIF
ncbi:MAG: porin [Burkholderiales bacterium]|nr:porin [Burkholderiales bacterium]